MQFSVVCFHLGSLYNWFKLVEQSLYRDFLKVVSNRYRYETMLAYSVFSLLVIATVKAIIFSYNELVPYTKLAYTTSGLPCIGGCSKDTLQCVAIWPNLKRPCTITDQLSPIYFTSQLRGNHKYCISNCGKFNFLNEWCFTTTDGKWDYCSSHVRSNHLYGNTRKEHTAYTKKGKLCSSACIQNDGLEQYYWCYYDKRNWDHCAPPALPKLPTLTPGYSVGQLTGKCNLLTKLLTKEMVNSGAHTKARDGFVAEIANALQYFSKLDPDIIQKVNQGNDGMKATTMINVTLPNGQHVYLPAVIKSTVGNNTFYDFKLTETFGADPENSRDLYESYYYRRSIGKKLKRPENSMPVSKNLKNVLSKIEQLMLGWYSKGKGSVDLLMVIFYPYDNVKVPRALGIDLTGKNKDGSVNFRCDDSIYFNEL